MRRIEAGSPYHPSGNERWITPVANFYIEHPKASFALTAAVFGVATGLIAAPLAYPVLTNFIEQASVVLGK